MSKYIAPLLLTCLLTACGGAESDFISACENSSGMTEENCECLAEHASKDLPDDGLLWLTAMIEEDEKALHKLRSDSDPGDWVQLAGFMIAAPMKCAIDMEDWDSD